MNTTPADLRARNLRTVGALAALFFLPLIAAFWMYYATDWRPVASTNNGELYRPARPLPVVELPHSGGAEADISTPLLAEKWSLVYVGDGACDEACHRALLVIRQTRIALNNELTRVKRVFIVTSSQRDREFLNQEHPGMILVDASSAAAAKLVDAFPAADRSSSIFVVDPLGNLVMRYDARGNPRGLLQDLKKLLKLSHIG